MKGKVINQVLYMPERIRTLISTVCSKATCLASLSLLVISSTLAICVSISSVVYADTLGYPWPTDTEAPCYYGAQGGSSCVNPADPTNQNYWYSWGVYDGSGTFHFYRNGYEYRNCTDYTQWKESTIGVSVPGTWGNGGQWYGNAPTNEQSTTAKPWDAAVVPGTIGHVAFVESANSDGTITVSEYNHDFQGHGDTRTATPSSMGFTKYVDFGVHPIIQPPVPDTRVPVVGDFNGDHHDDLLGSSKRSDPAPNLLTFLSTGSWLGGSSLWGAPSAISWANAKLTVGDLDGDGKADLFAIQPDQNGVNPDIYWLQSTGSNFANPQLVGVPGMSFSGVKEWVSGDFTGDGKADLLAVSERGDTAPNYVVFPSTGTWLGGSQLWSAPGNINFSSAVTVPCDVNGDGKADLLIIQPDSSGYADIYYSQSNGSSFATPVLTQATNLQFGLVSAWECGDFNGDGYKDLVAIGKRGDTAPNIIVFPSNGSGLIGSQLWSVPGNISYANAVWVPGDLNGDGKTDLFAIQTDSNGTNPDIYWIQSTGSSFATPQLVGVPGLTNSNVHWQR